MTASLVLATILMPVLTYLMGAIPFGLIIARLFGFKDVRQFGSGNIGATNVWRIAGAKAAIWVFVFDIGKGVSAVLMGRYTFNHWGIYGLSLELFLALCGIAAVIGHVFPVYLKFKGGKGVNTALGVVVTLLPTQTLISFGVFVVTLILFRYVSLGSILAALALSITLLIQKFGTHEAVSSVYLVMALALGILVVFAHRQNISRIISGTENRFSFTANSSNAK